MANLKNSQRISYKATYVQTSPTINSTQRNPPIKKLQRALEKTAFVQSLQIRAAELSALKKRLSDKTSAAALKAVEQLITDTTASSTLNNAASFAPIDPQTLISLANDLIAYREQTAAEITRHVATITSAYKNDVFRQAPEKNDKKKPTPPDFGNFPTGTKISTGTTLSGTAFQLAVLPANKKPVSRDSKKQSKGESFVIAASSAALTSGTELSALGKAAIDTFQPSNNDAIAWAERNQPKAFDALHQALQPYIGLSEEEMVIAGKAGSLVNFLANNFEKAFSSHDTKGTVAGFQAHLQIEPVGNLHLERIEMYPAGIERGELIHSVPLAPGETVNISHKEWSVTEQEFQDIVEDYLEGYSETGVAEKNDISMSNESQSKHATALNIGASLSASYASVTLSTNFGYNATSDDQQSKKDSRNHSMAITKKASSRTKKDHKVTFKVTSVSGSEDQSVRVITNPSDTDAMRIDYFQLARKWKVDLLRYGLRMTYDIVIPNPGSGLVTKVEQVKALDALIESPFSFPLPLSAITYNSLAADPHDISNYDTLAAQYNASVTAPPDARKYVNVHKETQEVNNYDHVHFDSLDFQIDENYYIYQTTVEVNYETNQGETNEYLRFLNHESISTGLANLAGQSGVLSIDLEYQYIYNFAINITFICRPKIQYLLDWRLQVWNQLRAAALDRFNINLQNYKDQRTQLIAEINNYDALTLRRMEQEEIMKGVLRWLLGPQFYLVPFNIGALFGPDSNDPEVSNVLDPNRLSDTEWMNVMEHGEFIKYIHNAIEWENVLYFTYPYFWDDNQLWDFKKFLFHPDPTHRTFLRSGAARVVLTIRPGFESSFTQLVETGAFNTLPGPHPYVTIAQEIQDFANTNYPGFPPANPEQNARPLLYLEQRRVWKEMQYIIQLLNAFKADPANLGHFPDTIAGNKVPAAKLAPYMDGPITINGVNYNGVNDYNNQSNAQQLALDPNTPLEALLPTYVHPNVPVNDYWSNPYFYQCPGETGDYDLISYGADKAPGGTDKNADISANAEASLVATWFEYTPTSALDIAVTMNKAGTIPPPIDSSIA